MNDIFQRIPEEIIMYIYQHISVADGISLAMSGASHRFTDFFTRTRGFDLKLCYGLKEEFCKSYIYLFANKVKSLDLSNCYWLSENSLKTIACNLDNLSELNVAGTALSLPLVIRYVLRCNPNLTRLSAPILEENWAEFKTKLGSSFQENLEKMKIINHLDLYILNNQNHETFRLVFKVLRWCVSCKELYLNFMVLNSFTRLKDRRDLQGYSRSNDRVIKPSHKQLYSKLVWMTSLEVLSINSKHEDGYLDNWCYWLLNEINPFSLQQLWLPAVRSSLPNHYEAADRLKSLCFGRLEGSCLSITTLEKLTHLGGVILPLPTAVPHLRFIQAYCSSYADLAIFCQQHPNLERLHIDTQACPAMEKWLFQFDDRWALARLRTLVYASNKPHPDILEQFIRSCPDLEALHIGWSSAVGIFSPEKLHDAYRSISRLDRLRKLTVSGVAFTRGTFLQQLLTGCSQLEILHLTGGSSGNEETFHEDLCEFLPLAKKLREFRYTREKFLGSMLIDLLKAVGRCRNLQRITIRSMSFWIHPIDVDAQVFIFRLVNNLLPELQLFCLVYPAEAHVIEELNAMFRENVLPSRPSFCCYIGSEMPPWKEFPRVHYDEIVQPNYFSFLPPF